MECDICPATAEGRYLSDHDYGLERFEQLPDGWWHYCGEKNTLVVCSVGCGLIALQRPEGLPCPKRPELKLVPFDNVCFADGCELPTQHAGPHGALR
ncbi:MAG: hypothetical protein IH885_04440 [Myxococcales bacterium]|nr:hypothetical protein [Myxococcales bacterium]